MAKDTQPPTTEQPKTRECPNPDCDAIIGTTEKTCPKCECDIADYETQINALETAQRAIAKKAKKIAPPEPSKVPVTKPSLLGNLSRAFTRKK